jgi:hypothetical protein
MLANQTIIELTFGDAEAVLERAQRLLNAGDVPEIMKAFTSDVVVRFADFPEMSWSDLPTFPKPMADRHSKHFCEHGSRGKGITGCRSNYALCRVTSSFVIGTPNGKTGTTGAKWKVAE